VKALKGKIEELEEELEEARGEQAKVDPWCPVLLWGHDHTSSTQQHNLTPL